jgi:ligand-binding sensor domain-containing protein
VSKIIQITGEKMPIRETGLLVHRVILVLRMIVLFPVFVYGQGAYPEFEHFSIEHGLSQSTVTCILQDSKGFIWIGTKDGLNKYDGYNFKVFRNNPDDSLSLSDNTVTAIIEDEFGDIWIGTKSGYLNKLDIITEKFTSFKIKTDPLFVDTENQLKEIPPCYSYFNNNTITTLCCDNEGNLLVGSWGKGLFKFDVTNNEFMEHLYNSDEESSLSSDYILSVIRDEGGVIWIGSFGGGLDKLIFKINPKSKSQIPVFKNYSCNGKLKSCISNDKVTSLYPDKLEKNVLWIGTFGGGINKLKYKKDNDSVNISLLDDNPGESKKITRISSDQNGSLWAGTFGDGLIKYDLSKKQTTIFKNDASNQNSINDNDIISLAVDRTGLIWSGTLSGYGINKLNPNKIKFPCYRSNPILKNSLSDNIVLSFAEDKEDNIWIGTYKGGLNKFDRKNKNFTNYKFDPKEKGSISSNYITSICTDSNDDLWIGTYDNGLNLLNKRTGRFIRFCYDKKNTSSISDNRITSVIKDKSGVIWIGTFGGGLNKTVKNEQGEISFIHFKNDQFYNSTIADNRIDKILEDKEGIIWVTTYNGCLCKYDRQNEEFTNYKILSEFASSNKQIRITAIYESDSDNLWIGTIGKGLISFDKKNNRFSFLNKIPNLGSKNVYGILGDAEGNLWISSDNGLFKYSPGNNSAVNFDVNDGLQSMQFNNGAAYKARNGEMFFGGVNGFNCFFPEKMIGSSVTPQVFITSVRTFNRELQIDENPVELSHYDNSVTFEFSVLDYTNPLQNQYAFKLVGYDENWIFSTGKQHSVDYSNLPPGEYLFKLKGSNSAGLWSKNEIQLGIIISQPYWQTWWFYLIIIFVVIGLIVYFFALRIQKYLAVERIKAKLSADLHDNIGSSLTEISLLSEVVASEVSKDAKGIKEKLKLMNERAGDLIGNMSDIVWLVNPKPETFYDLVLRLKDIYSPICEPLGIVFRIKNPEVLENLKITMEQRQNIYLIFKEAINNSLKYSGSKNICLTIETDVKNIELTLVDDGKGFDINTSFSGNGLKNMRLRAKALKGELEIRSISGQGTKIVLNMKVKK